MRKLLFLLALMSAMVVNAQTMYQSQSNMYGLNSEKPLKKIQFAIEGNLGDVQEVGIRLQRNLNKYLAWDMIRLTYNLTEEDDYDDYYWTHDLKTYSVHTGFRVYSPSIIKNDWLRVYAHIDGGLGSVSYKYRDRYYRDDEHTSEFAYSANIGIGLQIKKFTVGYVYNYRGSDSTDKAQSCIRVGLLF